MPKAEKGTPKDISNRMKAKGLGRLRWYCQVCQRQMRDENGFKCHTQSEGHLRAMLLVGENAGRHINDFSAQFKDDFITLLSRRWGTQRVRANQVYQEFISDKNHSHMNATQWVTLSEFVKYLGREGICQVDETEKGWFISWIDNSPKALAKQAAAQKKERQDVDEEQRQRKLISQQIEKAKREKEVQSQTKATQENSESREDDAQEEAPKAPAKLSIGLKNASTHDDKEHPPSTAPDPQSTTITADGSKPAATPNPLKINPLKTASSKPAGNALKTTPKLSSSEQPSSATTTKRPRSAAEEIMMEDMERKRRKERQTWSAPRGYGPEGLQAKKQST